VIMCPYGRFQSVMLDSQSLVVGYDVRRGEPRRGSGTLPQGDCVNCLRCVQVCPTGIDIRRGLQMECIACTACIDACDEVMEKVHKPRGLIRYTTLSELSGKARRLSPRALPYALLLGTALLTASFILGHKDFLDITLLRATGAPYQLLRAEGKVTVLNHFRLDLSNQTGSDTTLAFSLAEEPAGVELVFPLNPLPLREAEAKRVDFFVRFPPELLEKGSRRVLLKASGGGSERFLEVRLVGPDA